MIKKENNNLESIEIYLELQNFFFININIKKYVILAVSIVIQDTQTR